MTVSIALQPPVDGTIDSDVTPNRFGGLLGRMKKVGQNLRDAGKNLRNMSRADATYLAITIGAGLGAKTAAVSGLGLIGIATGGTGLLAIGVGLGVAAIGGASVGAVKSLVKHVRNIKEGKETKFFSRETLMNTASSAVIAAATFGASELFEFTSGQTFTHFLGNAFNKVADVATDKFMALVSGTGAFQAAKLDALQNHDFTNSLVPQSKTIYTPLSDAAPLEAPASPVAQAAAPVAPAHQPTHHATRPSAQHTATPKAAINAALIAAQEKAGDEYALNRLRELIQNTTGVAAPDTATAADLAKQFHPSNPDAFLKGLQQQAPQVSASTVAPAAAPKVAVKDLATKSVALDRAAPSVAKVAPITATAETSARVIDIADLPKMNVQNLDPKDVTLRAGNGVEVRMPVTPNATAEFNITKSAIQLVALEEHIGQEYATKFGEAAPQSMSIEDMAARLSPEDPKAYINDLSKAASAALEQSDSPANLDPKKMAASCVADLPKTVEAFDKQGGILPNTCTIANGKIDMAEGDYVIVRDAAEPNPSAKRGLRVLFSKFAEQTSAFISRAVGQETLPEMANEKLGLSPQ